MAAQQNSPMTGCNEIKLKDARGLRIHFMVSNEKLLDLSNVNNFARYKLDAAKCQAEQERVKEITSEFGPLKNVKDFKQ